MRPLLMLLSATVLLLSVSLAGSEWSSTKTGATVLTGLSFPIGTGEMSAYRWLTRSFLPTYLPRTNLTPHLANRMEHNGISIYRYHYSLNGAPVNGAATALAVKDGILYRVTNSALPLPRSFDTKPRVTSNDAARIALASLVGKTPAETPRHWSTLQIVRHHGQWHLVWKVKLTPVSLADGRFAYVDAHSGEILGGGTDTRFAASDLAKVFVTNPKRHPAPEEVELPWVDPDDGKLTSAPDEKGVRAVVAANCLDKGETTTVPGYGTFPICSPTQVADKNEHGNFVYEDWTKGIAFEFDAEDVYPEVAMYYHATKIYKFLRDLEVDGFHYLSGHNAGGYQTYPLIAIANFQFPGEGGGLSPMDNAFFSPNQPGFNEIFFANFPYQGDVLVFGQGTNTDFGYDGDVIYHEFGHAVEASTSALEAMPFADEYGFSNVPISINEGIADSFSFIMAGDACLGEFASEGLASLAGYEPDEEGFYCMRRADNEHLIHEDFTGESHEDGLPFVGMNWALYQEGSKIGLTREDFARLFLRMLLSFTDPQATPEDYAEIMQSEVDNDPKFAPISEKVAELLNARNFYGKIRARDITRPVDYIFSGGTDSGYGMPATSFVADVKGDEIEIAPAYVQFYFDLPECMDTLTVSGIPYAYSQRGSGSDPYYLLFVRKDNPITYDIEDYPVVVAVDAVFEPADNTYTVTGLEPGHRYYLHFVNTAGEGIVVYPSATASRTSAEPCGETPDDILPTDDELATDEQADADTLVVPDTTAKKNGGGCTLTML